MPRPGQLLIFSAPESRDSSYDDVSGSWLTYNLGGVVMFIGWKGQRLLVLDGETLRTLDATKWQPI